MTYRRSLPVFSSFTLSSRLVCWDDRWFYIEQTFTGKEGLAARGDSLTDCFFKVLSQWFFRRTDKKRCHGFGAVSTGEACFLDKFHGSRRGDEAQISA